MRGLGSLRHRLVAILAAVVAIAMGVVFLYVVPSLRDNLVEDRIDRLERVGRKAQRDPGLQALFAAGRYGQVRAGIVQVVRGTNAQISIFEGDERQLLEARPNRADVSAETEAVVEAARTGRIRDGTTPDGIVVAFPMPGGVVSLSQSVADIDETASLVERRILIAAALAVVIGAVVGWAAARGVSRRLQRMEAAAQRVAAGDFGRPIGDMSPDELGRLARAFDLMQSRLGQVDRSRKDFIANASHELRTPLFSLGGFLELLDDEDLDEETRREFLSTMREQVERLRKLATDLLDLSRLDSGAVSIRREPLDLNASARSLVREFRGLAARHGSRVLLARTEETPSGVGDEERVQQIGRALVDNAIRHNPPGTAVRVAVERADGHVTLVVSDDGPGIHPDALVHLFDRFYRGEDATVSGSGLGLAIARELAQRMGGRLEATSRTGETRFVLALPVADRAEAELAGART